MALLEAMRLLIAVKLLIEQDVHGYYQSNYVAFSLDAILYFIRISAIVRRVEVCPDVKRALFTNNKSTRVKRACARVHSHAPPRMDACTRFQVPVKSAGKYLQARFPH